MSAQLPWLCSEKDGESQHSGPSWVKSKTSRESREAGKLCPHATSNLLEKVARGAWLGELKALNSDALRLVVLFPRN